MALKREDRVVFKYLFNVNGLGLPKMTMLACDLLEGSQPESLDTSKVESSEWNYCRLCEQARYLHSSAHCCGSSPPFNYIKAAGTPGY